MQNMKYTASIILALATACGSLSAQAANESSVAKQDSVSAAKKAKSRMMSLDTIRPLWEPQNHYLSIAFGGGINSLKYTSTLGDRSPRAGIIFNIDYNIFFSKKFGFTFGAGVSTYSSKTTIDTRCVSSDKIPVTFFDGTTTIENCDFYTDFSGWKEIQTTTAFETPLGLLFRQYLKGNTTLLAGAGVKFMYPVKTSYRVKEGKRTTSGYIEDVDLDINPTLPQHGYTTKYDRPRGTTDTKHFSAGLYFDANLVHKTANLEFFYGIYGTVGLSNISKTSYIERIGKSLIELDNYCGVLSSNAVNEISMNAIGLRLGVKIPCPRLRDDDADGILDKYDKCLRTPAHVEVDTCGCPIDTDKDSVPDYLDKCPNTPQGIKVDSLGCPIDSDGDGVADYLDQCPETPDSIKVDENGCPLDSDGDGVADYLDKCPDTPKGRKVDSKGCPYDTDGDGVNDINDKCPDTPEGVKVDAKGCPVDSDGDGVPDYLDECPTIRGSIQNNGCPKTASKAKTTAKKDTAKKGASAKATTAKKSSAKAATAKKSTAKKAPAKKSVKKK